MTKIKKMADQILEELDGAKAYAESYVECKAKGDGTWANRYKEMAQDELKHAGYIHEKTVSEIEYLRKIYTPPADMLAKWDEDHREYVDKAAWIKQMLAL